MDRKMVKIAVRQIQRTFPSRHLPCDFASMLGLNCDEFSTDVVSDLPVAAEVPST